MKRYPTVLVLALCICTVSASTINPYYDQSSYVNPSHVFVDSVIRLDGKQLIFSNDLYEQNNILYLPLRETLVACGVPDEYIQWDDGMITITMSDVHLKTEINADWWATDNIDKTQTSNGHVMLRNGITYVPREMINEWKSILDETSLNELNITTRYSIYVGGPPVIVY